MTQRHEHVFERVVSGLRTLPHTSAIAAYGSTATRTWSEESDVDLLAILDVDPPVATVHFSADGVVVDLALRYRRAWQAGDRRWYLGLTPVWDPDGLVQTHVNLSEKGQDRADSSA